VTGCRPRRRSSERSLTSLLGMRPNRLERMSLLIQTWHLACEGLAVDSRLRERMRLRVRNRGRADVGLTRQASGGASVPKGRDLLAGLAADAARGIPACRLTLGESRLSRGKAHGRKGTASCWKRREDVTDSSAEKGLEVGHLACGTLRLRSRAHGDGARYPLRRVANGGQDRGSGSWPAETLGSTMASGALGRSSGPRQDVRACFRVLAASQEECLHSTGLVNTSIGSS
jgi:hypothetical protein